VEVFISNLQDRVEAAELEGVVLRAAKAAAGSYPLPPGAELSVCLVDDAYIRELNRRYRGKDSPTDVLSFPQWERPDGEPPEAGDDPAAALLGDVVISLETAARQAEEFGHSLQREVAFLVVHGVLHLLGHDHHTAAGEARMKAREEEVLQALNLGRE